LINIDTKPPPAEKKKVTVTRENSNSSLLYMQQCSDQKYCNDKTMQIIIKPHHNTAW